MAISDPSAMSGGIADRLAAGLEQYSDYVTSNEGETSYEEVGQEVQKIISEKTNRVDLVEDGVSTYLNQKNILTLPAWWPSYGI